MTNGQLDLLGTLTPSSASGGETFSFHDQHSLAVALNSRSFTPRVQVVFHVKNSVTFSFF